MKIQKDLYQIEKSKFKVVLGILFLVFSIVLVILNKIDKGEILAFDLILPVLFILNGLVNIMEGLGQSSSKLFGTAFLLIDDEHVAFKKGVLAKEKKLAWNEIQSIVYKSNSFLFAAADKPSLILKISDFDYILVKQIKEAVKVLATENGIRIG